MSTLSNAQVVAELGWTMQLIYTSTGGRLARYWRPPYGDTDARVDAIAKAVFGLTTVIWNHECVPIAFVFAVMPSIDEHAIQHG